MQTFDKYKVSIRQPIAMDGYEIFVIGSTNRESFLLNKIKNGFLEGEKLKPFQADGQCLFHINSEEKGLLQAFADGLAAINIFPQKENTDKIKAEAQFDLSQKELNWHKDIIKEIILRE